MRIGYVGLLIYIFILFACAPTKVKIYPTETPIEKTISEKTSSEKISKETGAIGKPDSMKPPSEKPSTEKTPLVQPSLEKTYDETVSEWKSYQDVVKWMEKDFSFDRKRYEKFEGKLPIPRTPIETFQLKSGIYIDAAMFLKKTLNRIDPSYDSRVAVIITRPSRFNHYVCSFKAGGKLFIMDYGTPYTEITGLHGPYSSLEEYKQFYEKNYPIKRKIEGITYLK